MLSTEIFDKQSNDYKEEILPSTIEKISIEAGSTSYWYKYLGINGKAIGINTLANLPGGNIKIFWFYITKYHRTC